MKDKFASRCRRCVFRGYPFRKKGWRVCDLEAYETFISRDVILYENQFPFEQSGQSNSSQLSIFVKPNLLLDEKYGPSIFSSAQQARGSSTDFSPKSPQNGECEGRWSNEDGPV